jgi:two-component system, OmpR family, sensor histidine kinase KdpD
MTRLLSIKNPELSNTLQFRAVNKLLIQSARYAASAAVVSVLVILCRLLHANASTAGFGFLLAVMVVSAAWGLRCAIFLSVLATLAYNFFFLPPIGTFTIADPQNWIALLTFLLTAIIASQLSERARHETENANSRRRELEQLYAFSQQMLTADNVLGLVNTIPDKVVNIFGATSAALFSVHSKNKKVYYSGLEAQALISSEDLERVCGRSEPVTDPARNLRIRPLRMGLRSVGALAIVGGKLSTESLEAIGSLVAIAIERAGAVEKLAHSEAGRESERLRSILLDSVTHDFRTPLTAIKASAQSLLGDAELDDASKKELLTVINEESDRLDRLVGEAAKMSQLDAHAVELNLQPHSIREAIDAALETNQKTLARHQVNLVVSDRLPRVKMDLRQTEEIISQLLDNAGKYSPPGTTITITSEVQGQMLVTSVADQGTGIDAIDQSMIFDKFYRGRGQRQNVQGTGMGLAIAKAIVEAHGGTITLTTQPGRGSVFSYTLPLSR